MFEIPHGYILVIVLFSIGYIMHRKTRNMTREQILRRYLGINHIEQSYMLEAHNNTDLVSFKDYKV